MIAKIIRPATCVNPAHGIDGDPAIVRLPDGTQPTREMPLFFTYPIGTTLEHPSCWMLCLYGDHNAPPVAEPVDDECRGFVTLHSHRREFALQHIREMSQNLHPGTPVGKFYGNLAKSYGVD